MMMKKRTRDAMMMNYHHQNEEQQPQRKQQRRQTTTIKKCVSFNTAVVVRETLHVNNYTTEERHACFYTKEEKKAIKVAMKKSIQQMLKNNDDDTTTTRGLEQYKSKQHYDLKVRTRSMSKMYVLQAQSLYKQGRCDYDMISNVYSQCTEQTKQDAYVLGVQDQLDQQQSQIKQLLFDSEEFTQLFMATTTTPEPTTCTFNYEPRMLCSMAA